MLITIAVVIAVTISIMVVGSLQIDGGIRAIEPQLMAPIGNSATWYADPRLEANVADPDGVYVIVPAAPVDHLCAAIRIDARTGVQTATNLALGPQSPFRPFTPAAVHAEIRGVRFRRFTVQLMSLPGGKGPGEHRIDSATGRIDVVLDERGAHRALLTRNAFNSSRTEELLSRVSADPNGRWIAAVSRNSAGWILHLFSRATNPT
jgi:hypothetical protein